MKLNLPVILLKSTVLIPETEIKLEFEDELSKSIIDEAELFHDNKVLVVTTLSLEENITTKDLPIVGTLAIISRKLQLPNGKVRIALKGLKRANVIEYLNPSKDIIESIIAVVKEEKISDDIKIGVIRKLYSELENYIRKVPYVSNSVLSLISDTEDISKMTDIIVNNLPLDSIKLIDYLKESNPLKRVEMILEDMYKEEQLFNIEKNIDTKVKKELDNDEKNFYLREKIKILQGELGEISLKEEEINKLKEKVKKLNSNEDIKSRIFCEINRYEKIPETSPEISMVRNYIDFMLNLPWNNITQDMTNLNEVKNKLDKSHYGLDDIKLRIIEYLAVKKHSNNLNTPIICLVGPPGVGKTTLVSSIANSMGRNFVKISLGGIDDEAMIKGHIRTYIGSSPGRIMEGIKRAKSSNPVFLIDEIDKMSKSYKGDPASALLEVLDSTQNKYFKDNYIEEEYDLSNVLFITTANDLSLVPEALKDRLEVINISGYTELEKLDIAKNYLIPKICDNHGIKNIKISDNNILDVIRYYTKESGLRELQRMLSKIVRKVVSNKVINNKRIILTINRIEEYLGKKIYYNDQVIDEIGVVNALSYTPYGGDIVPIEVNYYKDNSSLITTGSLGDIIKESSQIALSYIKANHKLFNIDYKLFENAIHINVPNISIKKDGPSAGIAITTAIISALTNLKINSKIAFTGEITLRGNILKIGGLKEKVIGAYMNGIDTIFIPYSNLNDLDNIPIEIKNNIKFIPVKKYEEVYNFLGEI